MKIMKICNNLRKTIFPWKCTGLWNLEISGFLWRYYTWIFIAAWHFKFNLTDLLFQFLESDFKLNFCSNFKPHIFRHYLTLFGNHSKIPTLVQCYPNCLFILRRKSLKTIHLMMLFAFSLISTEILISLIKFFLKLNWFNILLHVETDLSHYFSHWFISAHVYTIQFTSIFITLLLFFFSEKKEVVP